MINKSGWNIEVLSRDDGKIDAALAALRVDPGAWQTHADELHDKILAFRLQSAMATDYALSPTEIAATVEEIATGLSRVSEGLRKIFAACASTGPQAPERLEALANLHAAILGQIAHNAIPNDLRFKFSDDDLAETIPVVGIDGFTNKWQPGWDRLPAKVRAIGDAFGRVELANRTRSMDAPFVRFVNGVAEVYFSCVGKNAAASSPRQNSKPGWKGPFQRFLETLWPIASDQKPPPVGRIRAALK